MNPMWLLVLDRVEHFLGGMRANDGKRRAPISAGQEKIKIGQEWLRATICANQQDMRAVMSEMSLQLMSTRHLRAGREQMRATVCPLRSFQTITDRLSKRVEDIPAAIDQRAQNVRLRIRQ